MTPVEVVRGKGPVVLSLPHAGTQVPPGIRARLNDAGRALRDTDWHVDRLYEGLVPDVTVVRAVFHRYVVDANRPPTGESLYPGQATTDLVPLTDFDGTPIWADPPDAAEVAARVEAFHAPYHAALAAELTRVRERHGAVLLWDAHSIRSVVPRLFPGTLPVLNLGTFDGRSCGPAVRGIAWEFAHSAPFPSVLDGRFKGGWTTRHYGRPAEGVHALQMEIAQSAYLEDEREPWAFSEPKAARLRPWLADIIEAARDAALEGP